MLFLRKPQGNEVPKVTEALRAPFWHFWHPVGWRIWKNARPPLGAKKRVPGAVQVLLWHDEIVVECHTEQATDVEA